MPGCRGAAKDRLSGVHAQSSLAYGLHRSHPAAHPPTAPAQVANLSAQLKAESGRASLLALAADHSLVGWGLHGWLACACRAPGALFRGRLPRG